MARTHLHRRAHTYHHRATTTFSQADSLDAFAALLLADAEDDYDSLIALALADLANAYRFYYMGRLGRRRGHPGPYLAKRCEEFFELLLEDMPSQRQFRAFFRYALCSVTGTI